MQERLDRRSLLRGAGTVAAGGLAALAGCSGGGDPTPEDKFGGWMDGVENYDGSVVDVTDMDEIRVKVGTEGNGGYYAFSPPAIRVSTGTTVVWEWTGKGGGHNVVEEGGDYESKLTAEEGFTFSYTFESPGTSKYYCRPHEPMGMKGIIVVERSSTGGQNASSVASVE